MLVNEQLATVICALVYVASGTLTEQRFSGAVQMDPLDAGDLRGFELV